MKISNSIFLIGLIILLGCSKDGTNGKNSIVDTFPEPPGVNCSDGGLKIETGIDVNENNILDTSEIQNIDFICNGESTNNGYNSLVDLIPEPAGENCTNGGYKVVVGLDVNENNTLDTGEIQNEEYLCNGLSGDDGLNSLVDIIPEPEGENCPNGGYIINSGVDLNSDNVLDENEIQSSVYVCNGLNGNSDIQIRLSIVTISGNNTYGNGGASSGFYLGVLEKFNKNYWPGVDSIVFVTNLLTANSVSLASAELYNSSGNYVINNSTVSTNSTSPVKLISKNIYNDLPDNEIDLTIQLRSENSNYQGMVTGKSYLLLYRSE